MPSNTMPQLPFTERSDAAPTADARMAPRDAAHARVDAIPGTSAAQRRRRIAAIIAASLLVSAIVSGAATVIARRSTRSASAAKTPAR